MRRTSGGIEIVKRELVPLPCTREPVGSRRHRQRRRRGACDAFNLALNLFLVPDLSGFHERVTDQCDTATLLINGRILAIEKAEGIGSLLDPEIQVIRMTDDRVGFEKPPNPVNVSRRPDRLGKRNSEAEIRFTRCQHRKRRDGAADQRRQDHPQAPGVVPTAAREPSKTPFKNRPRRGLRSNRAAISVRRLSMIVKAAVRAQPPSKSEARTRSARSMTVLLRGPAAHTRVRWIAGPKNRKRKIRGASRYPNGSSDRRRNGDPHRVSCDSTRTGRRLRTSRRSTRWACRVSRSAREAATAPPMDLPLSDRRSRRRARCPLAAAFSSAAHRTRTRTRPPPAPTPALHGSAAVDQRRAFAAEYAALAR